MIKFIAEFCQNHNGDFSILREMIHQAKAAGAVYAKIQTIFSDDLTFRPEFEEGLIVDGKESIIKRPYKLEYERLKKLELSYEQQKQFVEECRKCGLIPLTTCFTRGSVSSIARLGFDTCKVASYDCGSFPFIKDLVKLFQHLIISTGATYDEEVERTAEYLKSQNTDFVFLHCVTMYPTPLECMNLNRMNYLRTFTSKVGLSEHTLIARDGLKASLAAIYLGADYIERHFTILDSKETKDGPVSITPDQLKELVRFSMLSKEEQKDYIEHNVPEFSAMFGAEHRDLSEEDLRNRAYYRGRLATHKNGKVVYNWDDTAL